LGSPVGLQMKGILYPPNRLMKARVGVAFMSKT